MTDSALATTAISAAGLSRTVGHTLLLAHKLLVADKTGLASPAETIAPIGATLFTYAVWNTFRVALELVGAGKAGLAGATISVAAIGPALLARAIWDAAVSATVCRGVAASCVPLIFTTEQVGSTDTSFYCFVVAARGWIRRAALTIATTALVGLTGAQGVPVVLATKRVQITNADLYLGLDTPHGIVRYTTGLVPKARSAIFLAAMAVIAKILVAHPVAAALATVRFTTVAGLFSVTQSISTHRFDA